MIAYDGTTLAADKLSLYGNVRNIVTKIHRMGTGELVGCAGELTFCLALIEWVRGGRKAADFPTRASDKDDWQPLLVIELDGTPSFYERTPYPIRNEQRCIAYGSGKEFAITAMHLGKTAREAVEVAIELDVMCGGGVDTLELLYEDRGPGQVRWVDQADFDRIIHRKSPLT